MRRRLGALVRATAIGLALVTGAWAQSPDPESLAAIRAELVSLNAEIQRLRADTNATGTLGGSATLSGAALLRIDQLEIALRKLTGRVEGLSHRIDRVVEDGTRRIGDLEFRLVELEGGDVAALGDTPLLGGAVPDRVVTPPTTGPATQSVELAVSEQSDFDTALALLQEGNVQGAKEGFERFLSAYPGGPLTADAMFHLGEAATQQGDHRAAAKTYLDSFTVAPNGPNAAPALLKVGVALGLLGQVFEACQTLDEVVLRFPDSGLDAEIQSNRSALGCS